VVLVASWVSERSASALLLLTASPSCWMRELMRLEIELVRPPIERSASLVLALMALLSCSARELIVSTEVLTSFSIAWAASPA